MYFDSATRLAYVSRALGARASAIAGKASTGHLLRPLKFQNSVVKKAYVLKGAI